MNAVTESESQAFHEAAHAAIHHYFGRPIAFVEIGEGTSRCVLPDEWKEVVTDKDAWELAKQGWLLNNIIACCAGRAAVDRCYGYKAKDDSNWKASDDYAQARECALQLNDGDSEGAELLVAWLARRAELLVEKQWPQIQRLGRALLGCDRIDGKQITHILKASGGLA
jgi:hypothetical protein